LAARLRRFASSSWMAGAKLPLSGSCGASRGDGAASGPRGAEQLGSSPAPAFSEPAESRPGFIRGAEIAVP